MWSQYTFEHQNFILAGKSIVLKQKCPAAIVPNTECQGVQIITTVGNYIEIGTNTYFCLGQTTRLLEDVLQGLTAAGGLADEVALFPESFVEQMVARCSVEGSKLWWNCNPEGPRHISKRNILIRLPRKEYLRLHLRLMITLRFRRRLRNVIRLFTGLWRKRMIDGLWVMAEGAVYDMFDEDKHLH